MTENTYDADAVVEARHVRAAGKVDFTARTGEVRQTNTGVAAEARVEARRAVTARTIVRTELEICAHSSHFVD